MRSEPSRAGWPLGWLPALAVVAACAPLLHDGFPRGHDWTFELVRVAQFRAALADGQIPPAWAPDLYGGYGSPIFLFYAPLFSLLASLLGWVAGSVAAGATAALVTLTALAALAMRACASAATGDRAAARVAVYVSLLHPYLLADKLLRNADAEFAALSLAPLALAGLLELPAKPGRALTLVTAGLGLTILSHNLTALVVAAALALGWPALYAPSRGGARLALGVALALALTAFFWLPALWLTPWVRTEDLLTGKFDFHAQFPPPGWIFGHARFYSAGWVTPAALLAGAGLALRRGEPGRRLLRACLVAAAGLLFLSTRASVAVWELVPGLALFQFPWRMQGPLALLGPLVAALVFRRALAGRSTRWRAAAEVGVLAVCLLDALPVLRDARPLDPGVAARLEASLRPERVRAGRHTATVRDEYLPRGADPGLWRRDPARRGPVAASGPEAEVHVLADAGTRVSLAVEADAPTRLRIRRWAFPGWRARIDGRPAPVETGAAGAIELALPAGESRVEIAYAPPGVRRLATALSAASLALLALGVARRRRSR